MPTNFQLEDKQTGQIEYLSKVDSKICKHLDLSFSKTHYTCGWFNKIGLMLAMGHN